MSFGAVDLEPFVQPIGQRTSVILDDFAAAVGAGDTQAAAVAAVELGRIIGAVAARMFAYECLLENVAELDPTMRRALSDLIRATPLPACTPTTLPDF